MILPKELEELKNLKRWAGYKLTDDVDIIPVNPLNGIEEIELNEKLLLTYDEAVEIEKKYNHGICFKFGLNCSGYGCIDLKNSCYGFKMSSVPNDVIQIMESYTEWKPMRDGVIIIYKADKAKSLCLYSVLYQSYSYLAHLGKMKLISSIEFLPITGNVYGKARAIRQCDTQIQYIYDCFSVLLNIFTVEDGIHNKIYDNIAKKFINLCKEKQIVIDLVENGVKLSALDVKSPSFCNEELLKFKEILNQSKNLHTAVILGLRSDNRILECCFHEHAYNLWKRGLPCSFEDAALVIIEGIDLDSLDVVVSEEFR